MILNLLLFNLIFKFVKLFKVVSKFCVNFGSFVFVIVLKVFVSFVVLSFGKLNLNLFSLGVFFGVLFILELILFILKLRLKIFLLKLLVKFNFLVLFFFLNFIFG